MPYHTTYDLPSIARYQKYVLYGLLANILAILLIFTIPQLIVTVAPGALNPFAATLLPILQIFYLAVAVAVFVSSILLGIKVYHPALGAILAIMTLIPCLGLICLLVLNSQATTILQKNGIRVGLMGARWKDLQTLQRKSDDGPGRNQ